MASSRRLRQESKTADSEATLPSYTERGREREGGGDRTSVTCACGKACVPPNGCCDAQGVGSGSGLKNAIDLSHKNSISSTGPTGLEVKVIKVTV